MFGIKESENDNNYTKYYEILGVAEDATPDELRKAFRKAAILCHRDKDGDPIKFQELAVAYNVLSNSERYTYDPFPFRPCGFCGEDVIKDRMKNRSSYIIFDDQPFIKRRSTPKKGEDVVRPLRVSLEDLYNGTSKKLSLARTVICSQCKGMGSKSGASMKCAGCQGSGKKGPCNECEGTGEKVDHQGHCPSCKGEKVVQEKKLLQVRVEKGMQNKQEITFPGEADEAVRILVSNVRPDTVTGDIVVELQQKEHSKFRRKGDDIFYEHTLKLTEALCGFQFVLTHLDNRQLLIKSLPGEVVKPDQYKAINNEGMPVHQRPFMKGKLYIHFTVDFPDVVTPEQCNALEAVFPTRPSKQISGLDLDECEETTLHDVNITTEKMSRLRQHADEAYDEDNCEDMPSGCGSYNVHNSELSE